MTYDRGGIGLIPLLILIAIAAVLLGFVEVANLAFWSAIGLLVMLVVVWIIAVVVLLSRPLLRAGI